MGQCTLEQFTRVFFYVIFFDFASFFFLRVLSKIWCASQYVCAFCAFFYSQLLALSIQMHIQHEFGKRSEITPTHDFEELRIFRKCKMKIEIFPKLDQMLYILCFEFYILYVVCCMLIDEKGWMTGHVIEMEMKVITKIKVNMKTKVKKTFINRKKWTKQRWNQKI